MSKKRLLPPNVRLALGLFTSSLILTSTSGGSYGLSASALLWAAPVLIATRCLPLAIAVPLIAVTGTLGRTVVCAGDVGASALASLILVLLALIDRVAERRLPRASLIVWPVCLTTLVAGSEGQPFATLIAPIPTDSTLAALHGALGTWAPPLLCGLVGQAFGALGTLHNRPTDAWDAVVRETGIRWAAVVGIFVPVVVMAGAAFAARL